MCVAGLLAFAGGAGFEPVSTLLAGAGLLVALFWHPSPRLSALLERVWLPLAVLLMIRAVLHLTAIDGDVVIPVVDLLLLLMSAEALRSLDAPNDGRLYALSFALILASTAYRPGVLFGVAFTAYVVVGTVALVVGHLRRASESHGLTEVRVGRRLLGGTAVLSLVVLLFAAAVFVSFPRVSRAWSGRGGAPTTSIAGFSDQISLGEHGSRIHANPRVILRVEFPDGPPADLGRLHWRGRSYDHFDGVRWTRSDGIRPSSGPIRWYETWSDSTVRQRIYAAPLDVHVLFTLHPVLDLQAHSRIHPLFDAVGDFIYWGSAAPVYSVVSGAGRPAPDALRSAGAGFMPDPAHYLQLPRLPERVHELADSLARGLDTRYDRVRAVESWLRTEFGYTLELPATAAETGLEHFLFERRSGHCEYFSSAMVVLLRSLGIHARNVNGFLGGRWSEIGDYLAVTQNEAHSWVEVWFPGYGWVAFDPTPAGRLGSDASDEWLWPGRFLFDALQHRWNTWVLDYDIQAQSGILGRFLGDPETPSPAPGAPDRRVWSPLWLLALLVAAVGAAALFIRGRSRLRPESRLYVKLLKACRNAGVAANDPVTPLHLVRELRRRSHPAAEPAGRLVERYVRARFAGERAGDAELSGMAEDLRAARRRLRARS